MSQAFDGGRDSKWVVSAISFSSDSKPIKPGHQTFTIYSFVKRRKKTNERDSHAKRKQELKKGRRNVSIQESMKKCHVSHWHMARWLW